MALSVSVARAATLSHPDVDAFNVRIGTQTFAPKYQFTTDSALVETAQAIRTMGSDVIKFALGRSVDRQYGLRLPGTIRSLTDLARDEPSCRRVLDMPFRHYVIWAYCFASTSDAWWKDGFSADERRREYDEIYGLCRHLLATYTGSGKHFYLGHWEGDWYLLPNYNTKTNPSPQAIQGMIDWLNTRQQAVDDATRDTPHADVQVYAYTEANRVRDAMVNGPASNQRLVNAVLPHVPQLDFVSWSSYDGQDLPAADLHATLDYLEAHLSTNKAARIPGRRVMIGEYGWGGSLSSAAQEPPTRAYLQRLLRWSPRFILFWEIYDNEGKAFWLVDRTGAQTPCYGLHQRLINRARLETARFRETHDRLPGDSEFAALLTPLLDRPLAAPMPLCWTEPLVVSTNATSAAVRGTLAQNVYGDDPAQVALWWGLRDGGTDPAAWEHRMPLGENRRFNPTAWNGLLGDLVARTNYYFRFHATNATGGAWSPTSGSFSTSAPNPPDPSSPPISLHPAADRQLRLTWPASAVGFAPYTTTNLRPPVLWTPLPRAPDLVADRWELTLDPSPLLAQFYRLQGPE